MVVALSTSPDLQPKVFNLDIIFEKLFKISYAYRSRRHNVKYWNRIDKHQVLIFNFEKPNFDFENPNFDFENPNFNVEDPNSVPLILRN